jgi:hypothetical protein
MQPKTGHFFFKKLFFLKKKNMRIKLCVEATQLRCWFLANESQTIKQLQKDMMDDLKLSMDPKQVELTLDNCTLLPQHTVKDIIREGDTIQ